MVEHPFLGLVALGPLDPSILRRLRTSLAKFLPLPVRVLPAKPLPWQAYLPVRQQYDAAQLLEVLLDDDENGAYRILGVTAVDLCIPIFTFVFGEGQLNGKAAIISAFRPRGDADKTTPPRSVFMDRLLKLGLHELGHTFGLEHCHENGCLMGFASNLEKLDRKQLIFCNYCQVLLLDFFQDQGLLPPLNQYAETHAPAASNPTGDSSHKRRR